VSVDGDVRKTLESGATLAPLVERFFDEVLVMDEDPAVRGNRLRLLLDVRDTLGRLGDFSQIPR
jgi:glycyl-tRNA synthetase beta chain